MQVLDWDTFIAPRPGPAPALKALAVSIGVFDGVHRGHRVLLERICAVPDALPAVVTFRQNPQRILCPQNFPGDILTLEQKLAVFEELGIQQTVLIDFSEKFSIIRGRDFIDCLITSAPVRFLALGRNFRCGYGSDTGVEEIRKRAGERGIETWIAAPVMEGGLRVSSSRIRKALASGDRELAERLLGRSLDSFTQQERAGSAPIR